MALLFHLAQNQVLLQSNNEIQKSSGQLTLENPLETALLLSLSGVGCIVLNQWDSTLKQTADNLAAVLDNILRVRQTSGQAIHAVRGWERADKQHNKVTGTYGTVHSTLNLGQPHTFIYV
ncbi:hypothetical protein ILYODFUR_034306 [Ilyodon furcidens]|uniref:Uncharacterized protein n=1 Tax=Ilyodon furcidens TaxID=33524 RepID=A0ABV0SU36_9TELE